MIAKIIQRNDKKWRWAEIARPYDKHVNLKLSGKVLDLPRSPFKFNLVNITIETEY